MDRDATVDQTDRLVARRFEDFYRVNLDHLAKALALTLGSAELGREAADEAMVRAYQRWRRVSTFRNPMGWAYTVGLNWGRTRLRRRRREQPSIYADSPVEDPPVSDPSVGLALAGLALEHRTVVVLRYYLDWSHEQIAERLRIPVGTVKSRLSRALDQLGNKLGEPS